MAVGSIPLTSYGEFVCLSCRDDPADECGDSCAMPWPDELAPFALGYWPTCRCCGREAQLVTPLVPLDA